MKAMDIRPRDQLLDADGAVVYTVLKIQRAGGGVAALIRFEADQGTDWRHFDLGQETPLTRPTTD